MRRRPGAARVPTVLATAGLLVLFARPARADDAPTRAVDFNRDVRPVLSEACFQCHGPDKAKRKSGLRLDTREGAFAKADGGAPVIVPGKPGESELIARVVSDDPDEKMPPAGSGKSLTPAQVETLRLWVAQGAEWKGHWSYLLPTRPTVPDVSKEAAPGFVRNDVDRFVLAKLAEKGMKPSPEADRVTLIRRLSFDLTGLPPAAAEVDAFVNDKSPDAFENLVARTLASPHFGERLAEWWLDLVRYADTTGYHGDNHRDVSPYRDWVINAFNTNKPFDEFTVEQLAGDLMPQPTDARRIASGYNKMLMTTQEGGAQAKEYLAKYSADRVRNASTVWMGATLGCAECHDHKFDPFTAKDFYRFAAFFADIQEAAVGVQEQTKFPTPAQAAQVKALDAEVARLQAALDTTPLAEAQSAWEQSSSRGPTAWAQVKPVAAVSESGATLTVLDDGSVRASGKSPDRDVYRVTFKAPRPNLTALRLELVPDGTLLHLGPGRADNGNFVLTEVTLTSREEGKDAAEPVAFSGASATFAQGGFPVAHAVDGNPDTGWAVAGETGRPNQAVFEAGRDFGPCCDDCGAVTLTLTLRFDHGDRHTLGRFKVSATDAARPVSVGSLPAKVSEALKVPVKDRGEGQKSEIAAYYRSIAPALQPTRDALALAKRKKAAVEAAMPSTVVTRSGAPRAMRVLPRGNWLDESGPAVTPSVPQFLKKASETKDDPTVPRATRLDLARWVISPDNPLTARVIANRLWGLAFGQGIVASLDDFGSQGAWPTHPELLDWLALEFREGGWDVKRLINQIVTSGTYRQTSHATEELRLRDPYNHWLARQGRFRIDAEAVRDNALAVSGLLVRQVGGPSARPYQPSGYWSHLNFPKREYQPDRGEGLYRRGLYTYWCRTFLHPSLLAFDAPTREECTVQRPRSNTPIQALVLLNDPTYVEAARALAERTIREGGSGVPDRLHWLYREVLSRPPRPAEASVLARLFDKHLSEFRADRAAATELVRTGERPVPADLDTAELAAWTSLARAVLNLHETVMRY